MLVYQAPEAPSDRNPDNNPAYRGIGLLGAFTVGRVPVELMSFSLE